MSLFAAETLKLTTIRSTWVMLGLGLAAEGLFAGLFVGLADPSEIRPLSEVITGTRLLMMILVLVLGALTITTEFRHGTAATTFLASPRRYPVLVAKLGAAVLVSLLAGLAFVAVNGCLALTLFSSRVGPLPPAGDIAAVYAGVVASFALLCAFGLGVGTILRNQVASIVVTLAFFFVLSPLTELIPGSVADYFPAQALGSLYGVAGEPLSQLAGGLVLAAWAAALLLVGAALTQRRDLTE